MNPFLEDERYHTLEMFFECRRSAKSQKGWWDYSHIRSLFFTHIRNLKNTCEETKDMTETFLSMQTKIHVRYITEEFRKDKYPNQIYRWCKVEISCNKAYEILIKTINKLLECPPQFCFDPVSKLPREIELIMESQGNQNQTIIGAE